MLKLKLERIKKTYSSGEVVTALKCISLGFRENELVSILGPSGCGKTTLLNIIGGLDHYDSGDLVINGLSTKEFKNSDWDAYRNRSIGFVFQSYNLIGHQTVLQNVEIAMTLSGVSTSERKQRAKQALLEVGLADHLNKRPNQLSGGQMQRVAIARALVNDPDIILADEPTGALDSHTSVQVMDILKEVAKTRLVIMVTHNGELAEEYSDRIIRFLDGEVQSDSNPIVEAETGKSSVEATKEQKFKKTSMSLITATALSFKNLLTKRGRTLITAFAGSIGIIGVALVLALSNGLSTYMSSMQSDTLSSFPITIGTGEQIIDLTERGPGGLEGNNDAAGYIEYPNDNIVYSYDSENNSTKHSNIITEDYLKYIRKLETELPNAINNISYRHGVNINLLAKGQDTAVKFETTPAPGGMGMMMGSNSTYLQELPEDNDFILSQYDLIGEGSRMPTGKNEVVLVVDKYNRIDKAFFEKLGITEDAENYKLTDFIGKTILKVISNDDYYTRNGDLFTAAAPTDYEKLYDSDTGTKLTITGILRSKEDVSSSYLSPGIAYTTALTADVVEDAQKSEIATVQKDSDKDVMLGTPLDNKAKDNALIMLGADSTPTGINIYPKDYESKDKVKEYLDQYNDDKSDDNKLIYSDMAEMISSITGTLLDTVTYVLTGFAAISLLVSTIMIGIITYVSVIERTKEIGILRSVGARKKDISRLFNAETLIIGFTAGMIGVGLSYLLEIPINTIISNLAGISGVANLNPLHAAALVAGSMILTLIAGFIPSRMAAKKDPVVALRSE
ncbi:ATP-binding cassette domain-containing protein [Paenibacillus motobuensis]|uniref:ABC transporter ATP-binding protein/permease n=1 Tax=Paenibacillus TaxID=44249 RepID=UPI00203FAB21|nr:MULTISPECIES: ABC transporter ATP-binding protein/permease [Paenibacillus]MCM3039639.1 ATP-binding cassette domain-containing protein [Paenibacillus lutimineralis]MCM3646743.1 ATP-binding cassette domain-containing protein [Paenibacillus motobuensis]